MRLALRLVIVHNLPFAAWTTYAVYRAIISDGTGAGGWACPVQEILHWCPSCGLTGDYARLLTSFWIGRPGIGDNQWLQAILAGFLVNAGWSLHLARRALTTLATPPSERESASVGQDRSATG